jgi:plastocyanin
MRFLTRTSLAAALVLVPVFVLGASARASTIDVQQVNFGFVPQDITIHVGDTVRWHWSSFNHTVTEGTDGLINGNELWTGPLDGTHTLFSFTFDQAFVTANPKPGGLYNYFCAIHFPIMVGTITVNSDPGTGFCFGDGSATACPCGNNSTVGGGAGCLNSLATGGKLLGAGTASISNDSIVLQGSAMPNSSALYFQGTTQANGGAGSVFGDGLRCAGGSVIRLGTKSNASGASQYPVGGDPSVSTRGLDQAGDVRTYQVWYRNAATFCNPETFNLSNGYQLAWGA